MNTIGRIYRLTDFGESHGKAMGGIIDGVPSRILLDLEEVQREVDKRRPGGSSLVTLRQEADKVEYLSGLTDEGVTLGTPIGFIIANKDAHSNDYDELKDVYRPGHADYTYQLRYGVRDHRGGGRASARETVCRVVAGAIAMQILRLRGIEITTWISRIGKEIAPNREGLSPKMRKEIEACRRRGDSVGGCVKTLITGVPGGVGDPVFGKVQARLAEAMMSINAVRGFQFGYGFEAATSYGSELLNRPDSILGGITTGGAIEFEVAFKPTPTLGMEVAAKKANGDIVKLRVKGRHDPCVVLRGEHVVRAMAAITMLDIMLIHDSHSKF